MEGQRRWALMFPKNRKYLNPPDNWRVPIIRQKQETQTVPTTHFTPFGRDTHSLENPPVTDGTGEGTAPRFRLGITLRHLALLILLGFVLIPAVLLMLSGCTITSTPDSGFEAGLMTSRMTMTYQDKVTYMTATVTAPLGSNNIENFSTKFKQGVDGAQEIESGGGRNIDTENQFKILDSLFGFLGGIFAAKAGVVGP